MLLLLLLLLLQQHLHHQQQLVVTDFNTRFHDNDDNIYTTIVLLQELFVCLFVCRLNNLTVVLLGKITEKKYLFYIPKKFKKKLSCFGCCLWQYDQPSYYLLLHDQQAKSIALLGMVCWCMAWHVVSYVLLLNIICMLSVQVMYCVKLAVTVTANVCVTVVET